MISALGLPDDLLRKLAIVVLLGFGIMLMIPPLAARLEAWLSRFAGRAGVAEGGGDGFWSGTAVGASLGLVYAPCAGPILAGVITVSASQSFTAGRLAVALSYGIGSAVVLYFLMLGGRRVDRAAGPARRRPADRDGRGDGRRRPGDARQLRHPLPEPRSPATCRASSSTRPKGLEDTASAKTALADIRGERPRDRRRSGRRAGAEDRRRRRGSSLPVLGTAPEFVDNRALVQHPRRPAADPAAGCAAGSSWSTSGPTAASTASARCPT